MKNLIVLLAILQVSVSGFALGALNCSNAERTFVRDEQEIWGANPIHFFVNGKRVEVAKEIFDKQATNILSRKVDVASGAGEEIFSTKLTFQLSDNQTAEDFVICRKWWNSAID